MGKKRRKDPKKSLLANCCLSACTVCVAAEGFFPGIQLLFAALKSGICGRLLFATRPISPPQAVALNITCGDWRDWSKFWGKNVKSSAVASRKEDMSKCGAADDRFGDFL